MKTDLLHNKLIADTVTDAFCKSVDEKLLPLVRSECGDVDGIQMYEDYIPDNFELDGSWYYPLTVIKNEVAFTLWIKWDISDKSLFGETPYAYFGTEPIEFSAAEPPKQFADVIEGRGIYFEGGCIKLTVDTAVSGTASFLAGKYSQTFIDEMTRQLTEKIAKAMSVEGLDASNIELRLIFAPDTYMEHTCENVTYRRLLITDKGCGARDFWIKWTRNNSAVAYSISDHASGADVTFELGEDVPQKIREREYRFLVRANTDKYHYSMGRKNITEWRELIKRALRRGDLIKVTPKIELAEHSSEVHDKLSDILSRYGVKAPAVETEPAPARDEELELTISRALEGSDNKPFVFSDTVEDEPFVFSDALTDDTQDEPPVVNDIFALVSDNIDSGEFAIIQDDVPSDVGDEPIDEAFTYTPETEAAIEAEPEVAPETESAIEAEPEVAPETESAIEAEPEVALEAEAAIEAEPEVAPETEAAIEAELEVAPETEAEPEARMIERVVRTIEVPAVNEDQIRAEIEAKLRLEYETAARRRAEQDNISLRADRERDMEEYEKLRRENLALMQERERLLKERESLELERTAEIQKRREEEQKLRDEIEARKRAEARERERLEEAAILAVENQRKAELIKLEEERRRIAEEAQREEELKRREETARLEAERRAEAERIKRDAELSKGLIKPVSEPAPTPAPEIDPASYTYVSKTVTLMFRGLVDPNLVGRIQQIMVETVKKSGKERVSIRVKAKKTDERTVILDFIKIPEQEMQLLIDIVNALGRSNIGIIKAIVK